MADANRRMGLTAIASLLGAAMTIACASDETERYARLTAELADVALGMSEIEVRKIVSAEPGRSQTQTTEEGTYVLWRFWAPPSADEAPFIIFDARSGTVVYVSIGVRNSRGKNPLRVPQ